MTIQILSPGHYDVDTPFYVYDSYPQDFRFYLSTPLAKILWERKSWLRRALGTKEYKKLSMTRKEFEVFNGAPIWYPGDHVIEL